jgi:hypothetical protein
MDCTLPDGYVPSCCQTDFSRRYAIATLVDQQNSVGSAIVTGHSARRVHTHADLVCMVTDDIDSSATECLKLVYDMVVTVPKLDHQCTPWNALNLDEYRQVLFVEANTVLLHPVDELFELEAPAGTFSWPEAGEAKSPYDRLRHGDKVPTESIRQGFRNQGYVCLGNMVLLEPRSQDYQSFVRWLKEYRPRAPDQCRSHPHEQAIVRFYYERRERVRWTFLHPIFNYIPRYRAWLEDAEWTPRVLYYRDEPVGTMPRHDESRLDLDVWWTMADQVTQSKAFTPAERASLLIRFDRDYLHHPMRKPKCAWCQPTSELYHDVPVHHHLIDCPAVVNQWTILPIRFAVPHRALK